MSENVLRVAK